MSQDEEYRRVRPLSDEELARTSKEEREWILAWRESEKTGLKYNESHGYGAEKTPATTSLDRQYAQLRRIDLRPPNQKTTPINNFRVRPSFGDSLEKTKLYFLDEWDTILSQYTSWILAMERCYIILLNKKESDKKYIIAQCQTRFSQKSKKITHWRMQQFIEKMQKGGFRFGLQITLTTDPTKFSNLKEVGDRWKFYMKKFMDFINMRLRRAGKKATTCYLKALELTESGLLHVHIGLYGPGISGKIDHRKYNRHTRSYNSSKEYLLPQKDINDIWKKYGMIRGDYDIGTWINRAPVSEVADYVTKHVAKSWGGESNEMLEAFLHYTSMRQWTSSNGAVPQEPDSVESWDFRDIAFSPGEAVLYREDLLAEGRKPVRDDTVEWENKQKVSS